MAAKNLIFSIVWIALLVFIAWPIAGICAGLWILLQVRLRLRACRHCSPVFKRLTPHPPRCELFQPFEACFSFLKGLQNFLEKLVTWPRDLGHAIANGQSSFPAPF